MMRSVMPNASAASPEPLAFFADKPNTPKTARTLTFKMKEIAR
jgi:hypothetical protein